MSTTQIRLSTQAMAQSANTNLFDATTARIHAVRLADTVGIGGTYTDAGGASGRGQLTDMPSADVDGVSFAQGDRILLAGQAAPAQNGIWVVTTKGSGANGVWDRASDFDADAKVGPGTAIVVGGEGTANKNKLFVVGNAAGVVIGGASGSSLVLKDVFGDIITEVQGSAPPAIIAPHSINNNALDATVVPMHAVRLVATINIAGTYAPAGGTSARGQFTEMPNGQIDGASTTQGDRILLMGQTDGTQNGIYVITTLGSGSNGVWDRATDFDADADVAAGTGVLASEGGTNAHKLFVLLNGGPVVVGGATSPTWLMFRDVSEHQGKVVSHETPTGALNGTNHVLQLAHLPIAGTEMVYLNGVLQDPINDYTIDSTMTGQITMVAALISTDRPRVSYSYIDYSLLPPFFTGVQSWPDQSSSSTLLIHFSTQMNLSEQGWNPNLLFKFEHLVDGSWVTPTEFVQRGCNAVPDPGLTSVFETQNNDIQCRAYLASPIGDSPSTTWPWPLGQSAMHQYLHSLPYTGEHPYPVRITPTAALTSAAGLPFASGCITWDYHEGCSIRSLVIEQ